MRPLPTIFAFLACLMVPAIAAGQNFVLQSSVIGSGAVNGSSTNYAAQGTVGQPAIGFGTSTNFEGSWGFWHTLSALSGGAGLLANLTVLLEGPYAGSGAMSAGLSSSIPTSQPFGGGPWNYGGGEAVASGFFSSNPDIVDWVFVQIRDTMPAPPSTMTVLAERAGFLKTDGSIVDTNGVDPLSFPTLPPDTYYIVVDHRNHARAMSAAGVGAISDMLDYDFTDALAKAYTTGPAPMKSLSDARFGLFAGDGDSDGQIIATDFNIWLTQAKAVTPGYLSGDYNLDTQPTVLDFNIWLVNTKAVAASQVPDP